MVSFLRKKWVTALVVPAATTLGTAGVLPLPCHSGDLQPTQQCQAFRRHNRGGGHPSSTCTTDLHGAACREPAGTWLCPQEQKLCVCCADVATPPQGMLGKRQEGFTASLLGASQSHHG